MKAVIYTRVSTNQQVKDGLSLEAQSDKLLKYCQLNDFEVTEIVTDAGLSGKTKNRPGFQRIMELVKSKEVDTVIVYSLSRFARNTVDTLEAIKILNKNEIHFHSLTENIDTSSAIGRFFVTTLAALAELEREQLSERIKEVMQYKKQNNERTGQVPFGYKLDADKIHLVVDPVEQRIIEIIEKLRDTGLSYRKIASELEARQIKNKVGRVKWNQTQVSRILKKVA